MKKTLMIALGVVVLLVAFVIAGYWYYIKRSPVKVQDLQAAIAVAPGTNTIRNDVEAAIGKMVKPQSKRLATVIAQGLQNMIEMSEKPADSKQFERLRVLKLFCSVDLLVAQGEKPDEVYQKLLRQTVNTPDRLIAYLQYMRSVAGEAVVVPSINERRARCKEVMP